MSIAITDRSERVINDTQAGDYLEAMNRFLLVTECRTQQELATFLGIWQSSISDAKRRESIPAEWLLTLWRKKGVNPGWVLTGQGAKGLQPVDTLESTPPLVIYANGTRPPEEYSTEELVIEMLRRAVTHMRLPYVNEK